MKKTKKEKVSFTYQLTTEWNLYNSLLLSCPVLSFPPQPLICRTHSISKTPGKSCRARTKTASPSKATTITPATSRPSVLGAPSAAPALKPLISLAPTSKSTEKQSQCVKSQSPTFSPSTSSTIAVAPLQSLSPSRAPSNSQGMIRPAFTSALSLTEMLSLISYSYWSTPSV